MSGSHEEGGGWLRALALGAVALSLSVARPSVLVAIPFGLMVLLLPGRALGAWIAAGVAAALALSGPATDGLWWVERGWAILLGGWFVALTLRWPRSAFLSRGLAAVGGAVAVSALIFLVRPGSWVALDWMVAARIRQGIGAALEALGQIQSGGALSSALVATVWRTAEVQGTIFPALLALASLAALGAAWWVRVRLVEGHGEGVRPLREFRFSDQLVWVMIVGMVLVLAGWGEPALRAGANALVFMGALYALRGAAVVVFMSGRVSFVGFLLLLAGLLFVAPFVLAGALVIGLGDTWLDLRGRARAAAG